ncbi:MAG: sugar ABC transporter permease [Planctomycetota bacterium]
MTTLSAKRVAPWALLTPFLVVFAIFTAWPLAWSLWLSLHQSYGPGVSTYVGVGNYSSMLADPLFWLSLKNTTLYTLGSVFIQLPLALGLAMLLEMPGLRGRGVIRLVLFSPSLVGVVFAAMLFGIIFEKRTGLLNQLLNGAFGVSLDTPWLSTYILWALILASLWMYVGFNMVYFSAALQNVRRELVEAATVDGAGPVDRFVHVVLPAIRPVASFVVLLSIIGSLQLFELPYLMLDVAGKPNDDGKTLIMYLYTRGFDLGDLGYASAVGWVLGLVLIGVTVVERLIARNEAEGSA